MPSSAMTSPSNSGKGSALPARTVALAILGLLVGFVLYGTVSPNRYVPYSPHEGEFLFFVLSVALLFLLFYFTRRLPWWVAAPLFAFTGFVFLVTWPLR